VKQEAEQIVSVVVDVVELDSIRCNGQELLSEHKRFVAPVVVPKPLVKRSQKTPKVQKPLFSPVECR
jgi:hypothetical protein